MKKIHKKINSRKQTHAQSAMEYLLTYGWSILIIAIALVTLFELGYFNGVNLGVPSECTAQVGFLCTNPQLNSTGNLTLTVGNNGGQNLVITGLGCSNSSSAPTIYSPVLFTLGQNQEKQLTFECQLASQSIGTSFKGSLWLKTNTNQIEQLGTASTTVSTSSTISPSGSNGQGILLVTNYDGGTSGFGNILEINANNGSVISNINFESSLFNYPQGLALSPKGYFYVVNEQGGTYGSGSISVLNASTNQVVSNITSPDFDLPDSVAFSPNGNYAYVLNSKTSQANIGNVLVINTATNQVVNAISNSSLFRLPEGIAITPNGQYAYVADNLGGVLLIISTTTNQVVGYISSPSFTYPISVAVDPSGKNLYVGNSNSNGANILIVNISSNTIINSISNSLINNPTQITFSGQYGYIMNGQSPNNVLVINPSTNQVLYQIPLPYVNQYGYSNIASYYGIATLGNDAYITNYYGGSYQIGNVSILNLQSNTITGNVGPLNQPKNPYSITSGGSTAYISTGLENIYEINLLTGQPQILSYSSFNGLSGLGLNNQNLYAVNYNGGAYNSGNIVILNPSTGSLLNTIDSPYFSNPEYITFSGNYAYITNNQGGSYSSGNILVINTGTNQIVNSIQSQSIDYPSYITTSGNSAYVYNGGTGNILIINLTTYNVSGSINDLSLSGIRGLTSSGKYIYALFSTNVIAINKATNQVANTLTFNNFDYPEDITPI